MAFGVSTDIGIDLGTASILVYIKGKGVVLKEPSVVAYDRNTNEIKAIGEEARMMIGRTPGNIVAIRPLKQGVIADYTITEKMIRYFIQKAIGKRTFRKPRICVCVPSQITDVERKAVEMSPNTMTKMRKNEEVAMSVLLKIATYLDCDISDMCEFVKDDDNNE